jgi:serine transporter
VSVTKRDDTPDPAPPFSEWGWILTMFGTAVGAGILYLPVQAGTAGIWALAVLSLLLLPLIYYSHKNVVTIVLTGGSDASYARVLAGRCGRFFSEGLVALYFLTFFVLLYSYLLGLSANMTDFLGKLGVPAVGWLTGGRLNLLIIVAFAALHLLGENAILRVMSSISSILIVLLFGISVYLIPFWDATPYLGTPSPLHFADDLLLILPILTLSFLFFPALSSMVAAYRSSTATTGETARDTARLDRIVLKTTLLLLLFVLFFVFSCLLSLSPQAFADAAERNLNCLALLGDRAGINPLIAEVGPLLGLGALITSFIGVFFAVRESALQLVQRGLALAGRATVAHSSPGQSRRQAITVQLLLFAGLWLLSLVNPSVMSLFGLVISPLVAIFIFIMPIVVLVRTHGFRVLLRPSSILVLSTGLLVLFSFELGTVIKNHFGF